MTPKDLWFLGIFQSAAAGAESLGCFYGFCATVRHSSPGTSAIALFARLGRLAGV